ncbi:KxYKxGKxW signal peptide domain-containing protein [Lactococcus lactis]|uniref:KxYKxGKxW signal peptide domain-containing protein n=1 Tax=Lactococcus lactis TaxID=1358 RepID=UPI0024A7F367|nr:KxYKxGKxW signal peptide domain-containing protein [Lactococcus lactis]
MSRRNNIKKILNSDKQERYRSYKRKKTWMCATITGTASVLGGGAIAVPIIKADTTSTKAETTAAIPDIIDFFNQAFTPLSGDLGTSSKDAAEKAEVSRYIYGNMKTWQEYNNWDPSTGITFKSTGLTISYGKNSVTASRLALNISGSGSMEWTLDLMPNTNYTFKMDHGGFGSTKNPRILIQTNQGQTLLDKNPGSGANSQSFNTGNATNDNGKVSIIVNLSGTNWEGVDIEKNFEGDWYFKANTPKISSTGQSPSPQSVYITDSKGKKTSEVLENLGVTLPEYYDSANQNTRIDPVVSSDPIITAAGDYTYVYTVTKWGVSEDHEVVVHVKEIPESDSISDSQSDSTSDSTSDSVSDSDSISDSEFIPDSNSGTDDSGNNSNGGASGNGSSGYLPKTGVENGSFFESAGLSAMGLALLGAIAAKKKKKNEN